MISLLVNGATYETDVPADTPLLWVLRDHLGLTGTKYGCGEELCGACTVHLDGQATRSCQLPVKQAEGKAITTIEGLADDHPVKVAWVEEQVPQCGYCQPGHIMTAAALLRRTPKPTDAEVDEAMAGLICRCGTYLRVRRAIHRAAALLAGGGKP